MKENVLQKKIAYTGTVTFPNKDVFPREFIAQEIWQVYWKIKRS